MREGGNLHELNLKHEKEKELLETLFDVEEQEHLAELKKRTREEHRDALIENHRNQIAKVVDCCCYCCCCFPHNDSILIIVF